MVYLSSDSGGGVEVNQLIVHGLISVRSLSDEPLPLLCRAFDGAPTAAQSVLILVISGAAAGTTATSNGARRVIVASTAKNKHLETCAKYVRNAHGFDLFSPTSLKGHHFQRATVTQWLCQISKSVVL